MSDTTEVAANNVYLDDEKVMESSTPTPPPAPPAWVAPNGGMKAWGAVAGGFLCQACSFGFLNVLGIFQTRYEEINLKQYSSSTISWIFTLQLFLIFFLSQMNGIAVDMWGPRPVMIVATFFELFGLAMLSLSTEYYQYFLAQGVCFGIGVAGLFMPGLLVAGQYFTTKRGLAVGIAASGGSAGGVVFPFILNALFDHTGFRAAIRWMILILGCLLALAIYLVSSPMTPKGWAAGKRSFASLRVFKRLDFLLFTIGGFTFYWGFFAPFDYLPSFATGTLSPSLALYTVSIVNAASIFGRIVPSYFSDTYGALRTMSVMAFATATVVLVVWIPVAEYPTTAGIIIFALAFGFSSGAFVSLMTPCIVELCGGQISELGIMLGTFMGINSFACLTGLPIQGAIQDHAHNGSYVGLIVFSGVTMMAGAILITVAWGMRYRQAKKVAQAASV